LREQAAGRGSDGDLDLVQERAGLAREQRIAQALKNAVTRKEFAPIGVLSEVLAAASGSVAAKLDGLPGLLKKVAPDLSEQGRDAIAAEIARARNDWVADTALLEVKTDPDMLPLAEEPEEVLAPDEDEELG
jgi:phage terminase Nu1 subunit (DNA packaging protein)